MFLSKIFVNFVNFLFEKGKKKAPPMQGLKET